MNDIIKSQLNQFAFLFLFASEFTFYLLILQTGVVESHNSNIFQTWMLPVGGIIGIISSIFLFKKRKWFIPSVLLIQILLCEEYINSNGIELFLFGLISGLTAPILIASIDKLWLAVLALALSYVYGTTHFDTPAIDRTSIGIFLSTVAFIASLFSQVDYKTKTIRAVSLYSAATIFLWLLLDSALFETLSRDRVMHIWGEHMYLLNIIVSHLLGLFAAYKAREYKHNDFVMLGLFFLSYSIYAEGWQLGLSLVYPFVISYYNVTILKEFMKLSYSVLALMTLSLWVASGMGLLIAVEHTFYLAWLFLFVLFFTFISKKNIIKLTTYIKISMPWILPSKS